MSYNNCHPLCPYCIYYIFINLKLQHIEDKTFTNNSCISQNLTYFEILKEHMAILVSIKFGSYQLLV